MKNNKFCHLDSSRQKINEQYIKDIVEHFCQHKDAAEFEDINNRPLQPNADDCGVYLLTFTKLLSQNPELLRSGMPVIDSKKERSYWANKRKDSEENSDKALN
jgi:Ulp1 family protease